MYRGAFVDGALFNPSKHWPLVRQLWNDLPDAEKGRYASLSEASGIVARGVKAAASATQALALPTPQSQAILPSPQANQGSAGELVVYAEPPGALLPTAIVVDVCPRLESGDVFGLQPAAAFHITPAAAATGSTQLPWHPRMVEAYTTGKGWFADRGPAKKAAAVDEIKKMLRPLHLPRSRRESPALTFAGLFAPRRHS